MSREQERVRDSENEREGRGERERERERERLPDLVSASTGSSMSFSVECMEVVDLVRV